MASIEVETSSVSTVTETSAASEVITTPQVATEEKVTIPAEPVAQVEAPLPLEEEAVAVVDLFDTEVSKEEEITFALETEGTTPIEVETKEVVGELKTKKAVAEEAVEEAVEEAEVNKVTETITDPASDVKEVELPKPTEEATANEDPVEKAQE